MARIIRGDIIWADLDPTRGHEQGGRRPVVVISSERLNTASGATVIAMALTTRPQRLPFPFVLELESRASGRRSWVKLSQIRVLSHKRLGNKIGRVSDYELGLLVKGLNELIT